MSRPTARPSSRVSIRVLGTCCGTLTVAAFVSAVYPAPEPLHRADRTATTHDDRVWSAVDTSPPTAGPLEIPTIGEVLNDYDAQMEALTAARAAAAAEDATQASSHPLPPEPARPDDEAPPTPSAEPLPPSSEPLPHDPEPPAPVSQAPVTPPVTDEQPPTATSTPPQATPPPSTAPPATPPPSTTATATPPPTTPPTPTEEPPPPPEAAQDTALALGERYEQVDADGTVVFSITLMRVDTEPACTEAGSLPSEHGRLIGLHVEVVGGPAPLADGEAAAAEETPSFSAADFGFVGADDLLVADVDTDSSAACLGEKTLAWPAGRPGPGQRVEGTLVLDVPTATGTVVYRPAS